MTRQEIEKEIPEGAGAIYVAKGMLTFFKHGIHSFADSVKSIPYDGPEDAEFLAHKREDGSWFWYKSRFTEAEKLLESLGYKWIGDEWVPPEVKKRRSLIKYF